MEIEESNQLTESEIDQLQAQEPLDWEKFVPPVGSLDQVWRYAEPDPSELGSISTTDGLEQQAELDPESNPELPFE